MTELRCVTSGALDALRFLVFYPRQGPVEAIVLISAASAFTNGFLFALQVAEK